MTRSLVTTLALLVLGAVGNVGAITIDELIALNHRTRGLEAMRSVNTLKMTGKASASGFETPLTLTFKRPGKLHMTVSIQGQNFISAYDGTTAWMINPFTGSSEAEKVSEEDAKEIIEQADFDGPFMDSKAKGYTLELIGEDQVEGTRAYKVKVVDKKGDISFVHLDAESGIELKQTTMRKQNGVEVESETYFGDYKDVGGVLLAHSIENRVQGRVVSSVVIEKIEANVAVDDTLFAMPSSNPTGSNSSGANSTVDKPAKTEANATTKTKSKSKTKKK